MADTQQDLQNADNDIVSIQIDTPANTVANSGPSAFQFNNATGVETQVASSTSTTTSPAIAATQQGSVQTTNVVGQLIATTAISRLKTKLERSVFSLV